MADDEDVSVAKAAEMLGLSRTRVFQLLADPMHPLTGPAAPGRGRGKERRVDSTSIESELAARTPSSVPGRQQTHDGAGKPPVDLHRRVQRLTRRVEQLEDRLADIGSNRGRDNDSEVELLREENRRLRYAKSKSDAASDALRDALDEHEKAARLRRNAEAHEAAAFAALRRAEKARDDST